MLCCEKNCFSLSWKKRRLKVRKSLFQANSSDVEFGRINKRQNTVPSIVTKGHSKNCSVLRLLGHPVGRLFSISL